MKIHHTKIKIHTKIFACFLLFSGVIVALLWLFQVVFLDSVYKAVKIAEVKSAMKTVMSAVNHPKLEDTVLRIADTRGINITIYGADGSVAAGSRRGNVTHKQTDEYEKLLRLASENGGEYFTYPDNTSDESEPMPMSIQFELPANQSEKPRMPAQIFLSRRPTDIFYCKVAGDMLITLRGRISPVDATANTLKIELCVITAVILLFGVTISFLIARHVARPLISLNESAKQLSRGRYDAVFPQDGYLEVMELSETLTQAQSDLSKVDELRRELLANVSHDLRTPLTLITGYAEAMRDLPGENNPENAQIIVEEAQRLSRLVTEVLDLSKLQSGAVPLNMERFNLTECVRGIVTRLSEFVRSDGYTVDFQYDRDADVTADENSLSQALYNLITNAVNFTGADKRVTVRQTVTDESVTIEVEDSGAGIPEEEMRHIWERYYRTGGKHKRAIIGSGIGLSIVKSVMEQHGAKTDYGVKPAQDHGSIFWLKIPLFE